MAIREILQYGDRRLNMVCEPITEIDAEVVQLMEDLKDTLYADTGVGLAAPQIGILKRAILVDVRDGSDAILLLNPEIVEREGKEVDCEGCLSYLGYQGDVARPTKIKVIGLNEKGETVEVRASDFVARVFCHEIDHLDGILYMSRATEVYEVEEEEDEEE